MKEDISWTLEELHNFVKVIVTQKIIGRLLWLYIEFREV